MYLYIFTCFPLRFASKDLRLKMGCATSTPANNSEAVENSRLIDQELDRERMEIGKRKHVKMLLLGPAASGKSTVLKQLRMIHNVSFSDEEVEVYRKAIIMNLLDNVKTLISAMDTLNIQYGHQTSQTLPSIEISANGLKRTLSIQSKRKQSLSRQPSTGGAKASGASSEAVKYNEVKYVPPLKFLEATDVLGAGTTRSRRHSIATTPSSGEPGNSTSHETPLLKPEAAALVKRNTSIQSKRRHSVASVTEDAAIRRSSIIEQKSSVAPVLQVPSVIQHARSLPQPGIEYAEPIPLKTDPDGAGYLKRRPSIQSKRRHSVTSVAEASVPPVIWTDNNGTTAEAESKNMANIGRSPSSDISAVDRVATELKRGPSIQSKRRDFCCKYIGEGRDAEV
ncbi:G-protein alpha subunit-domain-containing protein [Obelidium mucronatum]|nr:G-protein alpha subunit-domain-containing protein [Obelidium mucronatum]